MKTLIAIGAFVAIVASMVRAFKIDDITGIIKSKTKRTCPGGELVCEMTDDTGCASNTCLSSAGDGSCKNICTCKDHYMIAEEVTSTEQQCSERCAQNLNCRFAFYRQSTSPVCKMYSKCDERKKQWVGKNPSKVFMKHQREPTIVRDKVWPEEFFGTYAGLNYDSLSPSQVASPTWDGWETYAQAPDYLLVNDTNTSAMGYDWSLPSSTQARGFLVTARIFGIGSDAKATNARNTIRSMTLIPGIEQGVEIWLFWRDVETSPGVYDFSTLDNITGEIANRGLKIYIRTMTSDKTTAPTWFADSPWKEQIGDLSKENEPMNHYCDTSRGQPWDVTSSTFHEKYKALVARMTPYCAMDAVAKMYLGWPSCSYGDEGIGPDNAYPNGGEPQIVKERIDAWYAACGASNAHKLVMGGASAYGRSLDLGGRQGFIEMYWYREPGVDSPSYWGHQLNTSTGYTAIDETNPMAMGTATNCEVNEEVTPKWSAEWHCAKCASLDGDTGDNWLATGPQAGSQSRYGPIRSFPYRYMMSTLRSLQLRTNMMVADPTAIVSASLSKYLARSMGQTRQSTSDAWCFLVEATTKRDAGGVVKNWERWLYQRDSTDPSVNSGRPAEADAGFTVTPVDAAANPNNINAGSHEFVAKAATELGFTLEELFKGRVQRAAEAWVKVSYFDVGPVGRSSKIVLLRGGVAADGSGTCTDEIIGEVALTSARVEVRTASFNIKNPSMLAGSGGFDFCVAGRLGSYPAEILVSLVRVIMV